MTNSGEHARPAGFWTVLFLLLGTARRRAIGRQKRQQELMRRRSRRPGANWNALAGLGALALTLILHGVAAYVVSSAVTDGQRLDAERTGAIVVDDWFKTDVESYDRARKESLDEARKFEDHATDNLYGRKPTHTYLYDRNGHPSTPTTVPRRQSPGEEELERSCSLEAREIARKYGGETDAIETRLRGVAHSQGAGGFIRRREAISGLEAMAGKHSLSAMLGSILLLWWIMMLVFQGEGLELDLQRRRHPMWEWLFSHPVSASAIFTAEMLAPVAANPIYWSAPVFVGALYGMAYDPVMGAIAALVAGVPVTVAAACLGKALEIGSVIRFSPRSRGALLGLMSWLGYASLMLLALGASSIHKVTDAAGRFLAPLTALPWPWLGWFLGRREDGSFSFAAGMLACLAASGVVAALAVRFCIWGASQGLSGNFGGADAAVSAPLRGGARFGKDPLYRKEFLWFARDRSAVVQTILIPLTIAGFQAFNLRGVVGYAQGAWNYLSGAAILFGTYFLWILGPKSLASEGPALWLALTWPRGLESLLKAKAWLWAMISTGIVALVLVYAGFLFPAELWKIVLVGVGWLVFGRSMAEKTVTLVTVTSSSGDPEPIPRGRRWAASLGMLTFAIGVLTQQWHLAAVGIVYSYLTAAAMWENFRARLPFLYDPWSEKLPPPPTLMHAMVAISILVEGMAVVTGILIGVFGSDFLAVSRGVAYPLCALVVSLGVWNFLDNRGVRLKDVWQWPRDDGALPARLWPSLLAGAGGGLVLGGLGLGYVAVLMHFPSAAEPIRQAREQMEKLPGLKMAYVFSAVAVAPFVEEYLFRGLLFRALDREWGGWRAVLGSAAFFAIYHPAVSWLPVGLLGAANAWLFRRTGRLAPAVALHMVYNAIVIYLA